MLFTCAGAAVFVTGLAAASSTALGHDIDAAVLRFLLYYAGVFALILLTATVGLGVIAADRVVMSPGARILTQGVHRAVSAGAVGFLAIHIAVEIMAGRSHTADIVVPFLDHHRTFYLGLGTVASDLLVLIMVTGVLRGRFAAARPAWLWRVLHAVSYVVWPLAILHGLLGGRTAKPYVDWSYGACLGVVALALAVRMVAARRVRQTAGSPVADPVSWPQERFPLAGGPLAHVPSGRASRRALPAPTGLSGAHEDEVYR